MNAHISAPVVNDAPFLSTGLEPLEQATLEFQPIFRAIAELEKLASAPTQKKLRAIARQLQATEPSLTMIGQIKSGKTTLINAMIGRHDLLPADVNPWTSVVTTVHLSPQALTPPTSATFEFFEDGEWEKLMRSGGRIGELANRAGAEDQMNKVRRQIEEMREKSKRRLGRKFEMLLGQNHAYGYVDKELIERYVCLGDDFEGEDSVTDQMGRFADITKSAALHMHAPHTPMRLSIRDTPGINDTFLMREQITLQSIRESRVCVVVLTAHQALSSDDLALIRLISNAKSRDVIIFVNRIDELQRPLEQVEQIKESIRDTLLKHRAPVGVKIIFGSALWASAAVQGSMQVLPGDSKRALLNWAESPENRPPASLKPIDMLWHLCGVPQLNKAISTRMVETVVAERKTDVLRQVQNISGGLRAQDNYATKARLGRRTTEVHSSKLLADLVNVSKSSMAQYQSDNAASFVDFSKRLDRAVDGFLTRATDALISHLEAQGEGTPWQYDPTGLRVLLGSAYRSFERNYLRSFNNVTAQAVRQITTLAETTLGIEEDVLSVQAPLPVRIPPPIAIGQTIALDLQQSWWQSWWQRKRGYGSFAESFRKMIAEEIEPVVVALKSDVQQDVCDAGQNVLATFFEEQQSQWGEVASKANLSAEDMSTLLDIPTLTARDKTLTVVDQILQEAART